MGGSQFGSNYDAGLPGLYGTLDVPGIENIPWSLINPASWTDNNGNLWLFGGIGEDTTSTGYYLNDMWEFYPSLNEWAWTSANSVSGGGSAVSVYGTLGDFSPANIPGERNKSATWTDGNGNFWLLGGSGTENSDLELGWLNDLWEFNPSIKQWRWMSGSNSIPFDTFGTGGNMERWELRPSAIFQEAGIVPQHGGMRAGVFGFLGGRRSMRTATRESSMICGSIHSPGHRPCRLQRQRHRRLSA